MEILPMHKKFRDYIESTFGLNAKIKINNLVYHNIKYNLVIYFKHYFYITYLGFQLLENVIKYRSNAVLYEYDEEFLYLILIELKNGNFTYE